MSGSEPHVLVVGAGPAGSTAALLLARAGWRVRLLERSAHPRDKACGDCLSAAAGATLQRLGVAQAVAALGPARLAGWRVVSPGGAAMEAGFGEPGAEALAVRRARLDAALAAAARDAGVELLEGVAVEAPLLDGGRVVGVRARATGAGTHTEHRAPWTVDASGLRSPLARRLGAVARPPRLRKVSLTAHVRGVHLDPCQGHMHLAPGLCAGLAPVEAARGRPPGDVAWNLTLVADAERFGSRVAADAEAFLAWALPRFAGLGLEASTLRFDVHSDGGTLLASGPFDVPTSAVAFDGAVLVGDAGGYYDPFTGQGIHQALATAETLARVLDGALAAGTTGAAALRDYVRSRRRMVGGARRVQRLVEAVLARPRLADAALRRLGRAPGAAAALVAVTGDLRPPAALLRPSVGLSFLLGG